MAGQLQSGLFSLQANQISPLNAFVPLQWLQEQLGRDSQANMLLVDPGAEAEISNKKANEAVRECLQHADMGLEVCSDAKRDLLELRSSRIFIDSGIGDVSIESGKEAVALLKEETADLVVLDMIMPPGIDGLETYKRILELHPMQRAIIASGFSETDRVKEAQQLGAGRYVKKPYTVKKIGLAVKAELRKQKKAA